MAEDTQVQAGAAGAEASAVGTGAATDTGAAGSSPKIDAMVAELSASILPDAGGDDGADPAATTPAAKPAEKAVDPTAKAVDPTKPVDPATPAATPISDAAKDAIKSWRPEARAEFDKLPKVVQDEIIKREGDMHKGLQQYSSNASIGKSVLDVVKPYLPTLQATGQKPLELISGFMQFHHVLSTGTSEQKQQIFQHLAKEYGVYAAGNNAGGADVYVDPQVEALRGKLSAVESKLSVQEQRDAEARAAQLRTEVNDFASKPENQYFDEVANDIVPLLKTGMTLKDAYETAVWRNPVTRAKEQARLQAETDKANKAEAAKKAAEARAATGANVQTRPKNAGATAASTGTLANIDDVLSDSLKEIRSRK